MIVIFQLLLINIAQVTSALICCYGSHNKSNDNHISLVKTFDISLVMLLLKKRKIHIIEQIEIMGIMTAVKFYQSQFLERSKFFVVC